ncbi:MAG: c-type cytochrome [Planctomycetes bacterium]|nr:c-type cytochrome [Planctomycetota bacterium]
MPVTTKTFYNMPRMHVAFAISAVVLALSTVLAVFDDWHTEYRRPQLEARVWEAAFSNAGYQLALAHATQADLDEALAQVAETTQRIRSSQEYIALADELADITKRHGLLAQELGLFTTGNIAPVDQRIEKYRIRVESGMATNSDRQRLAALEAELAGYIETKRVGENELKQMEIRIEQIKEQIRVLEEPIEALKQRTAEIESDLEKTEARRQELNPGLVGQVGQFVRDMPLADWANPSIKPRQQLVDNVLTDVNLAQVNTLDRCMSCHYNIDKDAFTFENTITFLERQVANDRGQQVLQMGSVQPVVMVDFWERAIESVNESIYVRNNAPVSTMEQARETARDDYNSLLRKADPAHPIRTAFGEHVTAGGREVAEGTYPRVESTDDLHVVFGLVQTVRADDWAVWYRPLTDYTDVLKETLTATLDKKDRRALDDSYRHMLIAAYNRDPHERGRKRLSTSRELLAHPDLGRYAHPDSTHPIVQMGCTSCHGGSGEETQFVHTAHVPSDIWVDDDSGMLVPEFLVKRTGERTDISRFIRSQNQQHDDALQAGATAGPAIVNVSLQQHDDGAADDAPTAAAHGEAAGHGDSTTTIHADHLYADSAIVKDPIGPYEPIHGDTAAYLDPASGQYRRAVKQKQQWEQDYGWHEVAHHIWEFPMHELRFIESSCTRCHEQILDIEQHAPVLSRGRLLFTENGCIDCHPADQLGSPLRTEPGQPDVVQVGPNLSHVNQKLDEDMIASWVLAPKAFRPNTRMPHIWLSENGSSPIDIRRSRTEVGAIAHYLSNAPYDTNKPPYDPEPVPADLNGSPQAGRELFKTVGCTACHANVNEYGLEWVTLDIMERFGLDKDGAYERMAEDASALDTIESITEIPDDNTGFFELDSSGNPTTRIRPDQYTRLQWYLMAYERDRFTRFGPELSSVGTKLLHNRTEEQATDWLYDWVRNPSHYSWYTRMPNMRLSEQEAMDLTSYLLTQKHPTYEPEHFAPDPHMLDALLIELQAAKVSDRIARETIAEMTTDEKQMELGRQMIQFHGCFGCHQVPGFESGAAVSAPLTEWGRRDPHKLDFGYFDHVYESSRPPISEAWTTFREGTFEDAIKLTEHSIGETGISKKQIPWEHVHITRRGYLEAKLHNSRIFDRNRLGREGAMTDDGRIIYTDLQTRRKQLVKRDGKYVDVETGSDSGLTGREVEIYDVGKPYEKLRMPRFFMPASDTEALVTFVTSLKPPLVSEQVQNVTDEFGVMQAHGRMMAHAYNCMACHNIQQNDPHIQQYYQVRDDDGDLRVSDTMENLTNAPPRLIGNGAKTQHDWFYKFLNDVVMLRPWLEVRMPSFNLEPQHTQYLVDYVAGQTTKDGRLLTEALAPINATLWPLFNDSYDQAYQQALKDGNRESQADTLATAAAYEAVGLVLMQDNHKAHRRLLAELAADLKLYPPNQLPNREMDDEELTLKYGQLFYDLVYLRDTYASVNYPFRQPPVVEMSELDFRRGERFIKDEAKCFQCHAFGDYPKLEQIFDIEQAELAAMMGDVGGDAFDADYEDDYTDEYGEEDPYGDPEEDPYGEQEEADPYGVEDQDPYGEEADPYGAEEEDPYGGDGGDDGYGDAPPEPAKPTLYDNISAPNLALVPSRLQRDYIQQWLGRPATIMPGTKMPSHWGTLGLISHFATRMPAEQIQKDATYGRTVEDQVQLVINWLTVAADRGYTVGEYKLDIEQTARQLAGDDEEEFARIKARLTEAYDAQLADLDARIEQEAQATIEQWEAEGTGPATGDPQAAAQPAAPPVIIPSAGGPPMTADEAETDRDTKVQEAVAAAESQAAVGPDATGRIAGFVLFTGEPARPKRIAANAECRAIAKDRDIQLVEQEVIINRNGTLANVLLYLEESPDDAAEDFEVPTDPVMIDQVGCMYFPHVISVTTGQSAQFRNSDPLAHNLNLSPEENPSFNVSQPATGMVHAVTFRKPEIGMKLKCDIHNWMSAYVHVFDHPFHNVTNTDGVFVIDGLPAGTYDLKVHHEKFGTKTVPVTVTAGETTPLEVEVGS